MNNETEWAYTKFIYEDRLVNYHCGLIEWIHSAIKTKGALMVAWMFWRMIPTVLSIKTDHSYVTKDP